VPAPPAATTYRTDFGGLFYLLTCALELDLGEALWKVCLPEGEVLTHAAAALLGTDAADDPAPFLFGGAVGARPAPAVTPEQQREAAGPLLAALAGALPRRGLAAVPDVVLGLVNHASGRVLIAAAPGSPFALFAWPAAAPPAVAAGLRSFLAAWPRSAAPRARPALVEVDGTGRLRAAPDARLAPNIFIPAAPSAETAALLAQAAGALCGLFAARTGALSWPGAVAFVRRYLALPARVSVTADEMVVTLAAERIDLGVRRAGLDRDPGWAPWLRRHVRLAFVGPGGEAGS
jgi:hypothetical protein